MYIKYNFVEPRINFRSTGITKWILLLASAILLSACASLPTDLAEKGDIKGVRAELSKGGDINAGYGESKLTLLGAAAKGGKIYMVDELLVRGADIEIGKSSHYQSTPLMIAAYEGRLIMVKHLLAKGANIHTADQDSNGRNVLHHFASYGIRPDNDKLESEILRVLLDSGADILAKNKGGRHAGHFAAERSENLLQMLIDEAKARDRKNARLTGDARPHVLFQLLNATTTGGDAPLHFSARSQRGLDETRILLKAGADPNVTSSWTLWDRKKSISNVTPLHLAADAANKKTMTVLLRYGANPDAVTSSGETAQLLYRKSPFRGSDFDFGKVIAIAGGAALASSSSMSSAQKAEFMTAYTADVATDNGGTNTRNWGNQQAQAMQNAQAATVNTAAGASNSSGSQAQMNEESYTFTCPDTRKQHSLKVPYYTSACLSAAKNFAKVNGCNMVNDMSAASQQCQSSCGNAQCLEMPAAGSAQSGGDKELDFLNGMGR